MYATWSVLKLFILKNPSRTLLPILFYREVAFFYIIEHCTHKKYKLVNIDVVLMPRPIKTRCFNKRNPPPPHLIHESVCLEVYVSLRIIYVDTVYRFFFPLLFLLYLSILFTKHSCMDDTGVRMSLGWIDSRFLNREGVESWRAEAGGDVGLSPANVRTTIARSVGIHCGGFWNASPANREHCATLCGRS